MSSAESPMLFTREDGIAQLTLNRPKAGNSIDVPLARALMEAAIECDEDDWMGLITRVVADEALAAEAETVAVHLAACATGAMGRTRNLLLSSYGTS